MRTPSLSWQRITSRLFLSFTVALTLLLATAGSVLADEHEGTLPSTGGTVAFSSGVSITTTDGASSTDVNVTYTALSGDDVPGAAPDGYALGSMVFTLDAGGASFKNLAAVTIPYSADDVAAAKDMRDANVQVYSWDAISGSWLHTTSIPDVINRTLTIHQNTLGTYAVVVLLPDPPPPTPTPTPEPEQPAGGDYGVSAGMMAGLALLGMVFVMGGGYVLARGRNR